jgi:hypothetical protein
MNAIPTEISAHVSSFLSTRDLKSFRLCCKVFADVGQTSLFFDFEFRLWPSTHRLYQLEQLSNHLEIASKLRCLCFESGVPLEYADYRYWQANVYNDISSDWARNALATRGTRDAQYGDFHAKLQARFTPELGRRYTLYRWHLDQEASLMAERGPTKALARSIATLKSHNPSLRLKMVMTEPQITLEDLERFDESQYQHEHPEDSDPRRRVTKRREHVLHHFINFLEAPYLHSFPETSDDSNCQIGDLTAVNMPNELLTDSAATPAVGRMFTHLRRLDLQIGALPHSDWLSRDGIQPINLQGRNRAARILQDQLNRTTNLQDLKLEFPKFKEAEYSFEMFDQTNLDRRPRLLLPNLKSFELCRFRCSWVNLQAFLAEAKSLAVLKLSSCRLDAGSMLDLLHFVPQMKLQAVSIHGRWLVDDDGGEWHAHTADDFTADCFASTSYEGPYVVNGMKARVEKFMLDGGECPLPRWTVQGREEDVWETTGDTSWHYLPGLPRQY